jgi:transcriptional regulator with XRE-family HTH domain
MARSWKDIRSETINTPEREAAVERERHLLNLERQLYGLRKALGISQVDLARAMGTSQARVSAIESQDDVMLSTLDSYVEALGGHLEIRAVFPNHEFDTITVDEPADDEADREPTPPTPIRQRTFCSWEFGSFSHGLAGMTTVHEQTMEGLESNLFALVVPPRRLGAGDKGKGKGNDKIPPKETRGRKPGRI